MLVIGAGGLGVPVLQYLAAAGVGRIGIVDGDVIEASNLHRQPLYGVERHRQVEGRGRRSATAPAEPRDDDRSARGARNGGNLGDWLARYDLVVECSDNFATKFVVNDAAVSLGKPAVFASVYQYEGQLQVYLPREDWPCLRCLWPEAPRDGLVGNCAQAGVLGPVPAALGAMQAMQALKILLGLPVERAPALHVFDLLGMHWRTIKAARNPGCDHSPRDLQATAIDPTVLETRVPDARGRACVGPDAGRHPRSLGTRHGRPERHDRVAPAAERVHAGIAPALPPDGRYLLVCAHGVRSLALAEHLRSLGYPAVYSLVGGLAAVGS